jgi:hypothetical protein
MVKHAARNLVLALTLLALTVHAGKGFAQSTLTTPTGLAPTPSSVGGTDPEPQSVGGTDPEPQSRIELIILQILQIA